MTTMTIRTTRGRVMHAVLHDPVAVTSETYMAETYCGKEITGPVGQAESPDDVTCAKCEKAVRETVADELSRLSEEMKVYGGPPTVIDMTTNGHASGAPEPSLTSITAQAVETMQAAAPVLSSPEVTREPRFRYSPGRERHGRIRQQKAERRRRMKMEVKRGTSAQIPQG